MDVQTWKAYEEKHRQLKRKYRKQHGLTWLYWTLYYTATSTAVWMICFDRYINF